MGIGLGLVFPTAMNGGTRGVASKDAGVASATVNTSQQVGGSIGTALFSTVAASATTSYLAGAHTLAAATIHGYTTAFGWSAVLFAAGAILAPLLFGRARPAAERATGEAVLSYH